MEFDVGGIANSFMDSVSGAASYMIWIIIAAVVVFAVMYIFSFRHVVSVRILTKNGNSLPLRDKAREVKVDGATYWQLLKRRHVIPVPPASALIPLSTKGKPKFYTEFSWSEETGYVSLEYDVTTNNFGEKVVITQHGKVIDDAFQPFTTPQRSLLVNQLRKAENRRKKDVWDRLSQLATPLVLAMLFICVLVFWEDVAKPGKEIAALNVQMQEQNLEMIAQLNEISAQNARIVSLYTGQPIDVNQVVDG